MGRRCDGTTGLPPVVLLGPVVGPGRTGEPEHALVPLPNVVASAFAFAGRGAQGLVQAPAPTANTHFPNVSELPSVKCAPAVAVQAVGLHRPLPANANAVTSAFLSSASVLYLPSSAFDFCVFFPYPFSAFVLVSRPPLPFSSPVLVLHLPFSSSVLDLRLRFHSLPSIYVLRSRILIPFSVLVLHLPSAPVFGLLSRSLFLLSVPILCYRPLFPFWVLALRPCPLFSYSVLMFCFRSLFPFPAFALGLRSLSPPHPRFPASISAFLFRSLRTSSVPALGSPLSRPSRCRSLFSLGGKGL